MALDFSLNKLQCGDDLTILGIRYDLRRGRLGLNPDRQQKLISIIDDAIKRDELTLAEAAKLKGKLVFVASHFRGKHGRPFLRSLSHRQYGRAGARTLDNALRSSLAIWRRILCVVPGPRLIFDTRASTVADVTIFTDGSSPDPRLLHDVDAPVPRIGWVAFLRVPGQRQAVLYGSYTIPDTIIQEWIERRNQVGMVELFGAVVALETLAPRIKNTNVLLLVDAEAAQGARTTTGTFWPSFGKSRWNTSCRFMSTASPRTQT